ncbi:membrane-anchored junction protein [Tiliqua scincoides]|uniref:membrane-anchored junction protein n=1 Tax=Tiliqua scincoides TaxID=71010 RepID=UPI003463387C
MPQTRFFHVGVYVYKFKIKYGNTTSVNIDLHENIVNEELEEAIRVILGNLDDLRPFTTEHLVIFPYLNKWERVSDLRFRHGDAFLIPYPYVCTLYIELNSSVFLGEEEFRDTWDSVNSRHKPRDNMDTERAIKWRRLEGTAEMSHAQNQQEEIQNQYCGTTSSGYDDMNLWEHVQYVRTEDTENSQQEGQVPILPKRAEETAELKTRGFLELLKSTLYPPLLQRLWKH